MSEKDTISKRYMANPDRFADVFNAFLFAGKPVIKAENLQELDSLQAYASTEVMAKSIYLQRQRDLIKEVVIKQDGCTTYVLLGIENQSDIHYAMPVRNMVYDALAYETQIRQINDRRYKENGKKPYVKGLEPGQKLMPVITLTLYWGTESWDAPRRLSELLMPHNEKLNSYIADYDINLVSIIDQESSDLISHLSISELRDVFEVLHVRNDRKTLLEKLSDESKYASVSIENAQILEKFANIKIQRAEGEVVNVCRAIEELKAEWKAEGMAEGIATGKLEGKAEGKAEGIIEGTKKTLDMTLKQLVVMLQSVFPTTEAIWQQVRSMDVYKDVSIEQIKEIMRAL